MNERIDVDFTHSGIEHVPHLVYPDAKKLCLRRNRIKRLPESDDDFFLPNLTTLDLYDNLIPTLPKCLSKVEKLTWLDVSFNLIEKIDSNCLPGSIDHLYLTSNRFNEFPLEALKGLHKLKVLELGANHLKSLPVNALAFDLLEELWLSGNQITNETPLDFSHLPKLRILSLQCNRLQGTVSISSDSLVLPTSIEELYLGENKINNFHVEIGSNGNRFPNLHTLDLGHNELETISESIPIGCPNLLNFWINDNKLVNLEQSLKVVQRMVSLSNFFFIRNPCTINLPTYQVKIRLACPRITELDGLPFR